MSYWRKLLLALFAVCLFAGLALGAPLTTESICDSACKDGMLFIGDMYYDACFPYQDCPCEHLNWPLDGAIWGCDMGFLNTGVCDVTAQQYDLLGMVPHKVEWSESTKTFFVSYLNPVGMGSPLISALNLEEGYQYEIQPYDWDDFFQSDIQIGAIALDDDRKLLYVSNLSPWDATVKVIDITDPFNPVEPLCDPKIDLCAVCDCCDVNFMNMDMVFYKDKLYVSYWSFEDGAPFGDPTIAVFNADPGDVHYGELEDCVRVICPCACIDANDTYFLASNLAVSEVNGDVVVFSTYHPMMSMKAAVHFGFYFEEDWEDYINRPLGALAATNMSTYETICVDMNSAEMRQKLVKAGVDLCDNSRIELRALDVNPCGCGDCEDAILYVTAVQYRKSSDWSFDSDWLPCWDTCWGDLEVNFEKAICPEASYVLSVIYDVDDCNRGIELDEKGVKELPTKSCGCYRGHKHTMPWQPGDIVATSWVKENNCVVEAPVSAGGLVTITTKYLSLADQNTLGFDFMWDPTVMQFVSHEITMEGTDEVYTTLPSDLTPGAFSWDDILTDFQDGLGNLETLTLKMTFQAMMTTDKTVCFAGDGEVHGYECFAVTSSGGGEEPPTCCCGELLDDTTDPVAPAVGESYEGDVWIFQVECMMDIPADFVSLTFLEAKGGEYKLVRWSGSEWEDVADEDIVWSDGDTLMTITVASDFVCDPGIYAVVEADADLGDLNPDDGGGGGSGISRTSGSSGCNVGFSMAALLFAVPLVSIFRKR